MQFLGWLYNFVFNRFRTNNRKRLCEDECLGKYQKLRRLNSGISFMASEDFLEKPLKSKKNLEFPIEKPLKSKKNLEFPLEKPLKDKKNLPFPRAQKPLGRKILTASRPHKKPVCVTSSDSFGCLKTPANKEVIEISDDDDDDVIDVDQEIDVTVEFKGRTPKSKQTMKETTLKKDLWQDARTFRHTPMKGAIPKEMHSKMPNDSQDEEVKVIKETKPPPLSVSVFCTPRGPISPVRRTIGGSDGKYKLSTQKQSVPKSSAKSSCFTPRCREEPKKLAIKEAESVEDRHLYMTILQRFVDVPTCLLQTLPVPRNTREAERSLSSIDLNKSSLKQKSPAVQFVDLTVLEEPLCSTHTEDKKDRELKPCTSSKDELHIIDTPIRYSNSLEESLKSREVFREDYMKSIKEKYESKQKELEQQRSLMEMKAGYSALKNKQVHEESIERLTKYLKIVGVETLAEPEEKPKWPQLTPEIESIIDAALCPKPQNEVLVEAFSLKITRRDMHTLTDSNWLNDEVINFYMNLLIERGKQDNYPKVYAFNTFFYPRLLDGGHAALRRWTRKIDIFSYKMIFVPVHLGLHWCMAVINFDTKAIYYYDSMGSTNNTCLTALLTYLKDESMDKKKVQYDTSDWMLDNVKDIPHQMNGSDCGVFSCMYAEFIAREAKISFSQDDMPYFRRKMVYEIKTAKLLM